MSEQAPRDAASVDESADPVPLLAPRGGVPQVVETAEGVRELAARLAKGHGPVAIDAERASGFRYSARAQLVQINRAGVGIALVDPIAAGDLSPLGDALRGVEWVVHAAVADLTCLAEVGMRPDSLFDTELGGRIAGFERVSLGLMTERLLGLRLAKGHSAADWSIRPLPHDFLVYAALDVDVLLELRDAVEAELVAQGKLGWAHEEFEAVRTAPEPAARPDPWRRTSGIQKVRTRRGLAIVQQLWETRDELARDKDVAPGKLLPDRLIAAAGIAEPRALQDMLEIDGFTRRTVIRHRQRWWRAIAGAWDVPERRLPRKTAPVDPNAGPSRHMGKDNDVADRYALLRTVILETSERLSIPAENVMPPAAVRSLAWTPPTPPNVANVEHQLSDHGARGWQLTQLSAALAEALAGFVARDER